MKVKLRAVLARAINEGIEYGVRRAHKHVEHPDAEAIIDSVEREVWNAIDEIVDWPTEPE